MKEKIRELEEAAEETISTRVRERERGLATHYADLERELNERHLEVAAKLRETELKTKTLQTGKRSITCVEHHAQTSHSLKYGALTTGACLIHLAHPFSWDVCFYKCFVSSNLASSCIPMCCFYLNFIWNLIGEDIFYISSSKRFHSSFKKVILMCNYL